MQVLVPYWINREDFARGRIGQRAPGRLSWCFGLLGITRTQQLAALTVGDTIRQHSAETALTACLVDDTQLNLINDLGLCHGWVELYRTATCAAAHMPPGSAAAPTVNTTGAGMSRCPP
ncbi:lanthionine synthetase LanC family protein [Saccharopolyspora shandongensis]|uniref:lanthionine synthetase LanC family protein n=1 Tax=Saccharopolyspora shandongensis TaxID=418495 RepID=UPI003440EB29